MFHWSYQQSRATSLLSTARKMICSNGIKSAWLLGWVVMTYADTNEHVYLSPADTGNVGWLQGSRLCIQNLSLPKICNCQEVMYNLTRNFPQINLPIWQFYLAGLSGNDMICLTLSANFLCVSCMCMYISGIQTSFRWNVHQEMYIYLTLGQN